MKISCPRCAALWKEHAKAQQAVLKIAWHRHNMAIKGDIVAIAHADALYSEAGERRLAARKAVDKHKALHLKMQRAEAPIQNSCNEFGPEATI